MTKLEEFLTKKAKELDPVTMEIYSCLRVIYKEDEEPHYKDFLEWNCSYIHQVGVLAVIDGNKFDWCKLYIGLTDAYDNLTFIGVLNFNDGENMDLDRVLRRIVNLIKECDGIFEEYEED